MKRLTISAAATLALALGTIALATELIPHGVWHDSLLIIAGIFLGAVCAYVALIGTKLNHPDLDPSKTEGGNK